MAAATRSAVRAGRHQKEAEEGGQSEESRFGNFVEFHQFATERARVELSVAQRVAKRDTTTPTTTVSECEFASPA